MPGVTEQEIAQAKQMNLYQYMQLCEPDNFKPEGPGQFRHKGHSSLTFAEDGSWTYFKTKATGRTALNYLIAVEGVSFVEAVREINRIQGGVRPSFQPVKAPSPPAEKKPAKEFRLPKPDKNNYAATAYLRKRCIHPNVLTVCKQKRILYQTSFKDHPNCVFVGRDGNGEAKGGSLRGCSQIQFRRDIPGSKKIYPFYIEAAATADTVEVYEAPIDAMSGASLKIIQHTGNWRGVHYLALGGTDYAALDARIPGNDGETLRCIRECAAKAQQDNCKIVGTSADERYGWLLRPGYREMMRQVKAGEIDCIYIYRMRQISGKEQHLFRFFQQVMQHGIKVVTLEYSLRDRLHEYRLGMKIENYAARHKLPLPW